jgi:hypothetical protein
MTTQEIILALQIATLLLNCSVLVSLKRIYTRLDL